MFYHNINPILLKLGPIEIRYYGLIYALGFVITYFFLIKLSKERQIDLKKEDLIDLIFYLIIGVVAGARLFYVLFYNLPYFIENPLIVFAVWQGGLSFHGALVGAALIAAWFCKKHKIKFYQLADMIVIPAALALMLGRIANFINGELVGRITNVPWCVNFEGYEGCRHPSQLYESFKNLVIFAILWTIKDKKINNKKLPDGFLFWLFVMLYSTFRFIIEFWRAPDSQLGFIIFGLTMGQLLCLAMFVVGAIFMIKIFKK